MERLRSEGVSLWLNSIDFIGQHDKVRCSKWGRETLVRSSMSTDSSYGSSRWMYKLFQFLNLQQNVSKDCCEKFEVVTIVVIKGGRMSRKALHTTRLLAIHSAQPSSVGPQSRL